jgi:hypothetical protein
VTTAPTYQTEDIKTSHLFDYTKGKKCQWVGWEVKPLENCNDVTGNFEKERGTVEMCLS